MNKPIRGRLYAVKQGPLRLRSTRTTLPGWFHWHAEVWQGKKLLWTDDCRDRENLIPYFTATLAAFRRLDEIGQTFDSWRDIVDRAGKNL